METYSSNESYGMPECEVCPKQSNKLACLLSSCQARRLYYYKEMKKWHEEWAKNRKCPACKKHKMLVDRDNGCIICELTNSLIPNEETCDHFEEKEWNGDIFLEDKNENRN